MWLSKPLPKIIELNKMFRVEKILPLKFDLPISAKQN